MVAQVLMSSASVQESYPAESWCVVMTKPRKEFVAAENLVRQNYSVYLPRIQVRKRRSASWVVCVEPLFPRYLFLRINRFLQNTLPIRSTLGVTGLLRFGETAAVVSEAVIRSIQLREDDATGLLPVQHQPFKVGEAVQIIDGPLKGFEGIFNQLRGDARVMVLLEMLGQINRLVIDRDLVIKV